MAIKHTFTVAGSPEEVVDHVRWCRANLGVRGSDWDFVGGFKKVQIIISSGKMLTYYKLKFGNTNEQ